MKLLKLPAQQNISKRLLLLI